MESVKYSPSLGTTVPEGFHSPGSIRVSPRPLPFLIQRTRSFPVQLYRRTGRGRVSPETTGVVMCLFAITVCGFVPSVFGWYVVGSDTDGGGGGGGDDDDD